MPLFVTVTPGTTVTNSTTLDATTLNLLGTPSVDVTGTVDGGTLSLAAGSVGTTQLADGGVTFAKMQDIDADRLIGRDSSGSGDPEQLTVGGGLQFTGAGGIEIGNGLVTYAKIQNTAAGKRLIGRAGAAAGTVGEIEVGTGLSLSDGGVLSASNTVTANQSSSNFAIPASAGIITWAHGFTSQVPHLFNAYLVCTASSGDINYAQNDELDVKNAVITQAGFGGEIPAFYLTADGTNLIVRASARTAPILLTNKTTGVIAAIDTSKWAIKLNAVRFSSIASIP
jgi:hypothetical protein